VDTKAYQGVFRVEREDVAGHAWDGEVDVDSQLLQCPRRVDDHLGLGLD
jgi:hypothetical protein